MPTMTMTTTWTMNLQPACSLPAALEQMQADATAAIQDLRQAAGQVRSLLGLPQPQRPQEAPAGTNAAGLLLQLGQATAELTQAFSEARLAVARLTGSMPSTTPATPATAPAAPATQAEPLSACPVPTAPEVPPTEREEPEVAEHREPVVLENNRNGRPINGTKQVLPPAPVVAEPEGDGTPEQEKARRGREKDRQTRRSSHK